MSFYEFPHTHTYDSDLAWLIKHMKNVIHDQVETNKMILRLREEMDNFFETLDLDKAVKDGIQKLIDDGTILSLIQPILDQYKTELEATIDTNVEQLSQAILNERNNRITWQNAAFINNLESTATDKGLAANQGRVLKALIDQLDDDLANIIRTFSEDVARVVLDMVREGDLDALKITVVDNLTSTSGTNALSANQGRILNEKITNDVSQLTQTIQSILQTIGAIREEIAGIPIITIFDGLTRNEFTPNEALSSYQGKVLDDKIKELKDAQITVIQTPNSITDNTFDEKRAGSAYYDLILANRTSPSLPLWARELAFSTTSYSLKGATLHNELKDLQANSNPNLKITDWSQKVSNYWVDLWLHLRINKDLLGSSYLDLLPIAEWIANRMASINSGNPKYRFLHPPVQTIVTPDGNQIPSISPGDATYINVYKGAILPEPDSWFAARMRSDNIPDRAYIFIKPHLTIAGDGGGESSGHWPIMYRVYNKNNPILSNPWRLSIDPYKLKNIYDLKRLNSTNPDAYPTEPWDEDGNSYMGLHFKYYSENVFYTSRTKVS